MKNELWNEDILHNFPLMHLFKCVFQHCHTFFRSIWIKCADYDASMQCVPCLTLLLSKWKKHKNCSSTTNIWCCFMSGDRSVKLLRYKSVFMTSFNTRSSKDFQILSSFSGKASHFVRNPLYGNGNIADCRELTLHFNEGESCALSLFIINRRN